MCGIAGTVNWGSEEVLERMARVQYHRGPDDGGILYRSYADGSRIGLASRRLAILDLTPAGHMPMQNEDGSVVITFNGEIYNFRELRHKLEQHGCRFYSQTDTEVVLRLYEQEGLECLQRMRGMFAFAVLDQRGPEPILFLARDHFGIKPLYYLHRGRKFAFASEVKALLQLPGYVPELNPSALNSYLTFLWVPDPDTMFSEVRKLEAGHYAIYRGGELKLERYWDLRFPPAHSTSYVQSEGDLAKAVRHHLARSVREQKISDVPLGAFLSAGLDSTSIAAFLALESEKPLHTYTITFPKQYRVGESTLDDPNVAARVAERFGCKHHEIVVEPEVSELMPGLTWHLDEPIADPAIITAYLVCRAAREDVTVLLSGVGGDEIFGGYRKYSADSMLRSYQRLPACVRGAIESGLNRVPHLRSSRWKGALRLARKMARNGSLPPSEAFLMSSTYLNQTERHELCPLEIENNPWLRHQEHFETVKEADFLNQMLYVDTKTFMVSLNLTYNDKMSMASSVEVRVPFLDRELAEFVAWHVPPHLKLKAGLFPATKYILRKAMRGLLPEEVFRQPKAGFFAPIDYWLAYDLRDMVDELLSTSQVRSRGLFRPEAVERIVSQHRRGIRDWSMQIWQLLSLELWMRTFLDGRRVELPASATMTTAPAAHA